jgi:hypothetical protein
MEVLRSHYGGVPEVSRRCQGVGQKCANGHSLSNNDAAPSMPKRHTTLLPVKLAWPVGELNFQAFGSRATMMSPPSSHVPGGLWRISACRSETGAPGEA